MLYKFGHGLEGSSQQVCMKVYGELFAFKGAFYRKLKPSAGHDVNCN